MPGILWVWYFYRKDKYNPEPKKLIIRDFIWGILIVFPISIIESPFGSYLTPQAPLIYLFFGTIFIIGLAEEGGKAYVAYKLHYDHPEFDEHVDGIIYGITIGLGFAAFENLFYTILFGYRVGLVRAVLTSLAHASFTGIFGYYLSLAKHHQEKRLILKGLIIVTLLHGLYDFFVISGMMGLSYTIVVIAALQVYLASLIKGSVEKSPFE